MRLLGEYTPKYKLHMVSTLDSTFRWFSDTNLYVLEQNIRYSPLEAKIKKTYPKKAVKTYYCSTIW